MSLYIHRVVVRGEFSDLEPEVTAELAAEAPAHDIFLAAYTRAGTFTYEPNLHAFSFRFESRISSDDVDSEAECAELARARAEGLASAHLAERGITYKRLRSSAVDMADMWREA